MNKLIIYEYINRLKKNDLVKFAISQGINLEDYEINIIYFYIKNEYLRFFRDPMEVLNEIKYKVNNKTYLKIKELYDKYKNKIS